MASAQAKTRSRVSEKEITTRRGQPVNDNSRQQKETAEVRRECERLKATVEGLREEMVGLQGLREEVVGLHNKQLTEDDVKAWLRAALASQARAEVPVPPGQSTGGYSGLDHLQRCDHARMTLEM